MGNWTYTVAVDVDGVLATYDRWKGWQHIGEPIEGAREFMQWLRSENMKIIIHTTRMATYLNPTATKREIRALLEKWLDDNDIPYDTIWSGDGKPYADFYVDDRAVVCRPQYVRKPKVAFEEAITVIKARISTQRKEA